METPVQDNKCRGCPKIIKFFTGSSRCNICSNSHKDYKFCKHCCLQVNYKLLDVLLRTKYCYSCYAIIEISRQELNPNPTEEEDKQIPIPSEKEVRP